MKDQRLDKLAKVIVEYSVGVERGQLVRISGEPVATPLIESIYEAVLKAGAYPMVRCAPESLEDIFFRDVSKAQPPCDPCGLFIGKGAEIPLRFLKQAT